MKLQVTAIQGKVRDKFTNGNFVTFAEYERIVRKLKLKEIMK